METKTRRGEKAHKKRQRGASHAGFHFHNLYQCCQMKWFIRFILAIEPTYTATPLLNGSAFHEGKATFYTTGSKVKALRKVESELKSRKSEFYNDEQFLSTYERAPILLSHWIEKFGYLDLKRFNIVDVERELSLTIPGTKLIFTVRPDAIVEDKKSGQRFGMETKTSSFSIGTTEMGVYYGDQATAYTWAVNTLYDKPIYAIVPDIAYWNKASDKESNISCVRGDLIRRSERRIRQFYSGLAQLQSIMSQKVHAYEQGTDPYTLFQRNTHYCNAFYKACEYAEICDNDLTKVKRLPPGFRRRRTQIKPSFSDYVEDSITGLY